MARHGGALAPVGSVVDEGSLGKMEDLSSAALGFAVDSFHPLLLLRAYLCRVELLVLRGDLQAAVGYWIECRTLFNVVLGDGHSVPLLRVAHAPMVCRVEVRRRGCVGRAVPGYLLLLHHRAAWRVRVLALRVCVQARVLAGAARMRMKRMCPRAGGQWGEGGGRARTCERPWAWAFASDV